MQGFGDRLKLLREELGLTQDELAKNLKVLKYYDISRFEREERPPHWKVLILIAKYFNVTVDYLVGNSDKRQPDPLADLSPEVRNQVELFIEFAKEKFDTKK